MFFYFFLLSLYSLKIEPVNIFFDVVQNKRNKNGEIKVFIIILQSFAGTGDDATIHLKFSFPVVKNVPSKKCFPAQGTDLEIMPILLDYYFVPGK